MKKYKITYQSNKEIKTKIIQTLNISKEKLPSNILNIKELKSFDFDDLFENKKVIKDKQLINIFYELNLMLSSNMTLLDSLNILIKNRKDKKVLSFLNTLKNSLTSSKKISEELNIYKINYLVGAFFDISQDNGNISENVKALYELLKESNEIKKNFIKSITYPIILLVSFFFSLVSIFYFVIPKFKLIFEQSKSELPLATKILLQVQYLFENYLLLCLGSLPLLIIIFYFLYNKNENILSLCKKFKIKKNLINKIYII